MRVLHVLEAVGGGTLRHVADLVSALPAEHHVACPTRRSSQLSHPDPVGFLESAGAVVHPLAMTRRPTDLANLRAVVRLRALVAEVEPDVVHAHSSIAGALARLAVGRRVPVVWTPHGINEVSWISTIERRLRRRTDAIITVSPSETEVALGSGLGDAGQVRTILNGIRDSEPVTTGVRREIGIPEDAEVLGFLGRLSEQKDPLTFVEVARRVLAERPGTHVLCVGSGPLQDEVLRAAATLPEGRFHHVVRDAGAQELLAAIDVLVAPSRYEGGPYVLLEAALAGAAVVATSCTGARDYVVPGVSGLLAPVGDADGLARHALALLSDPAARAALVARAGAHVRTRHSLERMAREHQDVYASVAPRATVVTMPVVDLRDVTADVPAEVAAAS